MNVAPTHNLYRFICRLGDDRQPITHRENVAFPRQNADKAGFWSFHLSGSLGRLQGEERGSFFDSLAVFDVDANQSSLRLVGVQ